METLLIQFSRALASAFWDVITFPLWWYTRGLRRMLFWAGRTLRGWEQTVGLRFWARNLFVPMFGQADWQGRLISFFMRLAILFGRLAQVIFGIVLALVILLIYFLILPLALWLIIAPLV